MGKLSNKELKAYAGIGYVPSYGQVSAIPVKNDDLDKYLESLKYVSKRSRLSLLMPDIYGEEEQKKGINEGIETLLDDDGNYRKYQVGRNETGDIVSKRLFDDMEGISINDVVAGKADNPLYRQYQEQQLYKKIYADIDPTTDDFKSDIGKSWLQNVFDNTSTWSAIDQLAGGRVAKELSNDVVSKLEIKNNNLYYGGTKVSIPSNLAKDFNEWIIRKQSYEADGFGDQLSSTLSSFLLDYPFFVLGGQIAGSALGKIAPGLTKAASYPLTLNNLPAKATASIAQNLGMLTLVDSPRLISHTIEGGTDALLEDLKHIGEFSLIAGGFSTIGEGLGQGASRLLQKPRMLQLNEVAQFLRRNPQITKTVAGGITSGMLGYTTGGDTFEEKLATGLTFAGLHFASKNAWKGYIRSEKKSIMLENNEKYISSIRKAIENGMPLENAIEASKAVVPDYYYREGNKLYKVDFDAFVTKGEIDLIPQNKFPVIELTPEIAKNYRYITEIPPTAKVTMKEGFRQGKVAQIAEEIKKDFPSNPYNKTVSPDQYENYEYGKNVLAATISNEIYSQRLNSIFKKRQLPDEETLNKMMVDLSFTWRLPYSDIKKYVLDKLPEYFTNPEDFEQQFKDNPFVVKDLSKLMQVAADAVIKETKQKNIKSILDSILPSEQLLLEAGKGEDYNIDLINKAESVKRQLNLEEAAKGTKQPNSDIRYLDFKGELIPVEIKGKKARIVGTNVELNYDLVKNKIKGKPDATSERTQSKSNQPEYRGTNEQLEENRQNRQQPAEERGRSTETSSGNRVQYGGQKQPGTSKYEEASKILGGDIPTSTVVRKAKEVLGNEFGKRLQEYADQPNNKSRLKSAKDKVMEEGLILEDFARRTVTADMIGEKDINADLYGRIEQLRQENVSQKESIAPKTFTEPPQETNVKKPIQTPKEPEKVPSRASQEEIFQEFSNEQLKNAAEGLTKVYEPKTADFRDESGKIKSTILQRMIDIEDRAKVSAEELSKVSGKKVLSEDVIITALKPYYTSSEIGTLFALRNIHSDNAKVNTDFVRNRIKKYGLSFTKERENISPSEIAQTGLTVQPKPSAKLAEEERANKENEIIAQSMEVQNKITDLLKEQNNAETTEERKKGIRNELNQLYDEKQKIGKRIAEISSDDMLFENEKPNVQRLNDLPEERVIIEDNLKSAIPNLEVSWDAILPEGKSARTYVDDKGITHIDFSKLASTNAPLEERIHAQALMAVGKDKIILDKLLKQLNPQYDGVYGSAEWRIAHEELARRAMESRKDGFGIVDRVREVWEKLKNFFDGQGWYSASEYYRRLLDNKIELGEGKPSESLYETTINEHANDERRYESYSYYRDTYGKKYPFRINLEENILVRKAAGVASTLYRSAIQNRNLAYQTDKRGIPLHPTFARTYDNLKKRVVLQVREDINRINADAEGWNNGKNFLELPDKESYTAKMGKYETEIIEGRREPLQQDIKNNETLDEFIDRAARELNYSDAEKAIERRYQVHARLNQEHIREGHRAFLKENATTYGKVILADSLTKNELKKYFGNSLDYNKSDADLYKDANDYLQNNPKLVDKIIDDQINKIHPIYYSLYRYGTRPTDPSYYSFAGERPVDELGNYTTDKSRIARYEKVNGYGKTKEEAQKEADKYYAEGFAITSMDKIGDLISKEQYDRLTANQLMNLVDLGHIDANNSVVRSLLNSIKTGNYEQHTINKKYIRGMHYTPEELERGVYALTNEAVSASTKRYGLAIVRSDLAEERARVNTILKAPNITGYEKDKVKRDLEYSIKLYNQVSKSDQSFIDTWRRATTAWYIGVKPSFWFQQGIESLPAVLPEAIAEAKNTTLNGNKVWTDAYGKAFELAKYIRAEKNGETIEANLDQGLIDAYKKLDAQHLMGAVGIEELAGKGRDLEMRYGSDLYKGWNTLLKLSNMGGAIMEKFTRMHSLATFYELGKAKNLEGTKLDEYLANKVDDTMSSWGAIDRPPVFQSKQLGVSEQKVLKAIDKSFFTFRTFANKNLGQYDRLFRNRQWGALGVKVAIGAGMSGATKALPFAATVFALANLFSDNDTEYEAIKLLDELDDKIGGRFGSILGRGVLSQFGINMQNMFDQRSTYITDVFAQTRSQSAEGKLMEAMLGAPYGLAKDFIDASYATTRLTKELIKNDYTLDKDEKRRALKNLYKFSPLFFRNVLNAMSLDKDGIQIKGKEILKSDDLSWADIVYKAMGFNPSKVAETYEYQFQGTPAKLTRVKGRINELKKIRREISMSREYSVESRRSELKEVARLLKENMKREAELIQQLKREKRNKLR